MHTVKTVSLKKKTHTYGKKQQNEEGKEQND